MKVFLAFLALVVMVVLLGVASQTGASRQTQYMLKPYSGTGSGVLAPGTVLKEQYVGPQSVIGKLSIHGVWILERSDS